MSDATTNYTTFRSYLYSVGFLCQFQLLLDINWFILEYHKLYWQMFANLDLLS